MSYDIYDSLRHYRNVGRWTDPIPGELARPVSMPRRAELKLTQEQEVAAARRWVEWYARDRAARGIPPEGLRVPHGVKGLLAQRMEAPA